MQYRFLRFPDGKSKALTLSYDDGIRSDLRLAELLDGYGVRCTFNLNNYSITGGSRLTPEEITEHILNKGHEIALHGASHRAEGTLTAIEGIQDVLNNRLALEKAFGRIIRGMAYPDSGITYFVNGADYASVRQYLKDLGVVYVRTLGGDNDSFALPRDWYAWMPTAHHTNPKLFEYLDKFLAIDYSDPKSYGARRPASLFYLWGHSFEFDRADNWDLIETFCKKAAGDPDVWYATNMEIYDYVTAYHALVWSADFTRVYNPSLQTVWFDVDRKIYKVGPGETFVF